MKESKLFYLRDEKGSPIACIASCREGDHIYYGLSTHNPLDKFDRDRAREVAIGRLNKGVSMGPIDLGFKSDEHRSYGFVNATRPGVKKAILLDIVDNKFLPNRTRDVAKKLAKRITVKTVA